MLSMKPLFLSLLLCALPHWSQAETWNGTAAITFAGTSTLHDWSGKVSAEPFTADVTMQDGKPTHVSSTVTVKAAGMDTAEPKRDANMRKAMKIVDFPLIVGKIDADFKAIAASGDTPTALPLEINLLGKLQKVTAKISQWKLTNGKASFDLEFPVSMEASGISVPAVLIFIRVGDSVTVRASVTLKQN